MNFVITQEGLADQVLGTVVAQERPDLETQRNQLILQGAENKRQLQDIEDRILEIMSNSEDIFNDETAIQVLSKSKKLSDEIAEKQRVAELTEAQVEETRRRYEPVSSYVARLFFTTTDLAGINSMYQVNFIFLKKFFLLY